MTPYHLDRIGNSDNNIKEYVALAILIFILLFILGLKKDYQKEDVNRDGVVDIKDLLRVQKEIMKGK